MMENVNRTCDELHFNGSFRYTPPPGFPQSEDSERTWYAQVRGVAWQKTKQVHAHIFSPSVTGVLLYIGTVVNAVVSHRDGSRDQRSLFCVEFNALILLYGYF